jgi:hypothetical protein
VFSLTSRLICDGRRIFPFRLAAPRKKATGRHGRVRGFVVGVEFGGAGDAARRQCKQGTTFSENA